ncbi:MAG TPA: hypothetical protein VH353_11635 [Caulobacteraceae bacterium]|nr:hypothetical protein [Caulobacteraceae bacterium]
MPTYTIQTPNGQTIRIPAPDFTSAMQAAEGYVRAGTGYLTTAARAVPFLTEAGAGYSAGLRSLDDLLAGRAPDLSGNWTRARAEQQAVVDSFQREHPVLSNNATALGTVAPMAAAGLGLGRVARPAAPLLSGAFASDEAAGSGAATRKLVGGALRNAFTGGAVGALYGAARPGTAGQRVQYAADAVAPGALWGAGLPLGIGAAGGLARSIGETLPGAGALGSELADTLRRAATGRTSIDQSRQISLASSVRGEADAVRLLRQMGVSPETLEQAQSLAPEKPITTAEAIGPGGTTLAQGLGGRAGTTGARADAVLGQRATSRPDRLLMDASQVSQAHPLAVLGDLDQLLADSRKNGESYFEEATSLAPPFSERSQALFESPEARRHWDAAAQIAKSQSRDPADWEEDAPGYKVARDGQAQEWNVPSLKLLDALKDQLQGALEGQTGPLNEKQQAIRKIADGLHASLTSAVPSGMAYAKAHEFRGDLSSTEAAWRNAQGRLLNPAIDSASFDNQFHVLMPFEKDAATAAGAGDIANLAYEQPFDPGCVLDPITQQKMRVLFSTPGAQRLTDALTAEGAMANFEQPPPSGLAGLNLRLRAAGQAPLNMAGRNSLGSLLYQDPATTAQTMRSYGDAPNAFDAMRMRLPPLLQYGTAGLGGALQASGSALPSS